MKELQKLLSKIRQTVDHYEMIVPGDKIAVGVSGGKDSLALLYAISKLREFYPIPFEVCGVSINLGFSEDDQFNAIRDFAKDLGVEYKVRA